jgi:Domain of Unknown Function (DUF1206)
MTTAAMWRSNIVGLTVNTIDCRQWPLIWFADRSTQPFGFVLLGIVAFGLLCLTLWRIAQSILDADRVGNDAKALVRRIGYGVSGAVDAGLAVFAVSVMMGLKAARGTDEQSARDWTAYLLGAPLGRWLVGAVGLAIAAAGIGTAINGLRASFENELPGKARRCAVLLGRLGFMARGVVFVIVGVFLINAAVDVNPREARGPAASTGSTMLSPRRSRKNVCSGRPIRGFDRAAL